ncbi:MAG: DedA family protein [Candidatus Cohnella colombiensis]|uniref:DedA family protein n=1 Tax=Candidatus Cohnella colombiensis TaxID=3121368 RepID=A0AA95EUJ9_9BACL|nr:MAG: DedA family protein [Cohnella sp.]
MKFDIVALFNEYGYEVLFLGLLLEYVALPFPGETTMLYAGYLSYEGVIRAWPAFVCAFAGTTIGMTITYFVGRTAGSPFLEKYGKWVFITPAKMEKTRHWFERYGKLLVFIGYFIPGVRHVTGYFSGIIGYSYRSFAIYAYTGALFWCGLFIFLGNHFGSQWDTVLKWLHKLGWQAFAIAVVVIIIFLVFKLKFKKK